MYKITIFAPTMPTSGNPYCNCLYFSTNALARTLTRMAENAFAPLGLAPSYAFILMTVNRKPGIHAGELASVHMLSPSTVTRLVDKLEEKALVKKVSEGRLTLLFPTETSVALNDRLKDAWYALYQRFIELLGEEYTRKLTAEIYKTTTLLEHS